MIIPSTTNKTKVNFEVNSQSDYFSYAHLSFDLSAFDIILNCIFAIFIWNKLPQSLSVKLAFINNNINHRQ